jgi:predicted component of type VI protein secretion system
MRNDGVVRVVVQVVEMTDGEDEQERATEVGIEKMMMKMVTRKKRKTMTTSLSLVGVENKFCRQGGRYRDQ